MHRQFSGLKLMFSSAIKTVKGRDEVMWSTQLSHNVIYCQTFVIVSLFAHHFPFFFLSCSNFIRQIIDHCISAYQTANINDSLKHLFNTFTVRQFVTMCLQCSFIEANKRASLKGSMVIFNVVITTCTVPPTVNPLLQICSPHFSCLPYQFQSSSIQTSPASLAQQ